jgi:hypothetical protein
METDLCRAPTKPRAWWLNTKAIFKKCQSQITCQTLIILLIFELAYLHGIHMKNLTALLSFALMTLSAPALAATCDAQAAEKKLAGAAKNSFVQKCEKDAAAALAAATATCEAQAADKKLAGAAKNSFTKKCIKDATGG